MALRRRFGFRMRLTLIFLAVFVVAATVLLVVEYAVVSALFDTSIAALFEQNSQVGDPGAAWSVTTAEGGDIPYTVTVMTDTQLATRGDVLGGLVFWSSMILAAFSVAAAALAWWMAGRPLRRIRDVTAIAQRISERDLSQRLSLAGPDDEIKTLGDTFDRMLSRLETAFRTQSEFIANASHELKTPLATARAALEVPLMSQSMPDDVRVGMQRAVRANRRSEKLIDALLDLARAADPDAASFESVPLREIALAERDAFCDEASSMRVAVSVEIPADARVRADPVLVSVLIGNLLANAIRYNVEGGHVRIRARSTAQGLQLVVSNTGAIIHDDVRDLVKPFHRGASSRLATAGRPGTGLGLAIVTCIAAAHSAEVALSAVQTGGLEVVVTFIR